MAVSVTLESFTPVSLTPAAAAHVQRSLARRGKGIGLRLGVKTSGCSGLAYKLEFADTRSAEDQEFESHGVRVLIDPKSLAYLDGTELDFVREGLNEGFKFRNPNVKNECGCGESFTV
jgi:iron-sulfur cluster assembly protein